MATVTNQCWWAADIYKSFLFFEVMTVQSVQLFLDTNHCLCPYVVLLLLLSVYEGVGEGWVKGG